MEEDVGRSANTKTKSSSNSFLFLFMHALSTYLINGDIIIGIFEFAAAVSNNHIHVHTRMRHISTCSANRQYDKRFLLFMWLLSVTHFEKRFRAHNPNIEKQNMCFPCMNHCDQIRSEFRTCRDNGTAVTWE